MGWSLNVDYDASAYSDPHHVSGTYAYGLKDCVINGQCDTPPPPKPSAPNYTLQTSNTGEKLGVQLVIKDAQGNTFNSDYINPQSNKVYNDQSNPSAVSIEGKKALTVSWTTYSGGPSGTCPGTFDLTTNMNIMVNAGYESCQFSKMT